MKFSRQVHNVSREDWWNRQSQVVMPLFLVTFNGKIASQVTGIGCKTHSCMSDRLPEISVARNKRREHRTNHRRRHRTSERRRHCVSSSSRRRGAVSS